MDANAGNAGKGPSASPPSEFWACPLGDLYACLGTAQDGLSVEEARLRAAQCSNTVVKFRGWTRPLRLFLSQFNNPITFILIFAAVLSLFVHDPVDASIILVIVLVSGILGFVQEHGASSAVEELLNTVRTKCTVLRGGQEKSVPAEEVVPGDVVLVSAGSAVPGDCRLIDSNNLFVDEASLTGETYPVEKRPGILTKDTPSARRHNVMFTGSHVVSGTGRGLVVATGKDTEFGKISERLKARQPETEFERGVRRFGHLLLHVTLVLVIVIFGVNVYLGRHVLDSFLFSLALAVGLTPQLLPAIITVNLAHGARQMARDKVIVKRLSAIEDFGSMNVLCSDKTGTLTQGKVELEGAEDALGRSGERVRHLACVNARFQAGFANPIDDALLQEASFSAAGYEKVGELPYDFVRKRLSVLVQHDAETLLVMKGAVNNVLAVCAQAEMADGTRKDLADVRPQFEERCAELGGTGRRTLAVAYKRLDEARSLTQDDEQDMILLGLLVFADPPKPGVQKTIADLAHHGVRLKVITGDSNLVGRHVAQALGVSVESVITGSQLHEMSDPALVRAVEKTDLFAEVEPNQKERIILACKKAGNVVGFMGDGINDASALHAADVGISVDTAVDVAKEAASIVLLEKDLGVLLGGIRSGRITFANTIKYVLMAVSANFGNMFSMAGASLFLPFLPLLPKQVLLTNLLTDFPEMAIASDAVDPESVRVPHRWDIHFIRRFMIVFGLLSSVFDFLTFGVLVYVLQASEEMFRCGWFVESVISATFIVLVVRSRRPFFQSPPGRYLVFAVAAVQLVVLALPYSPLAPVLGFTKLPGYFLCIIFVIVLGYVLAAEATKRFFYRRFDV